jgi:ABC-2 type transport system ATP-binding protein
MTASPETVVRFCDLQKTFRQGLAQREVQAVKGIDLEVYGGEIFGFLGPNGAGKTTSMKIAMGLISATAGHVELFGQGVGALSVRARIGYLPEHPSFYTYLTASEIMDFYGSLFGLKRQERRQRIDELLELVGLAEVKDRRLRGFSKGMLQRVGIAQALINDPDLVVLDEPLSGLDPIGRREVRSIIVSLREQGKTVFFSSHILHDIETICDRVGIISGGRLVRLGPLDTLLAGSGEQVAVAATGVEVSMLERLESMGAQIREMARGHEILVTSEPGGRSADHPGPAAPGESGGSVCAGGR